MADASEECDESTRAYRVVTEVTFKSSKWFGVSCFEDVKLKDYINNVAVTVFRYLGLLGYDTVIEVSLLLADNDAIQTLNKTFRNQDCPTNVLSFPAQKVAPGDIAALYSLDSHIFLGDVAISYQKILDESIEQAKTFKEYFTHILVHALLHLLGYDHITANGADQMEKLEVLVLASMGFQNPYAL